MKKALKISLSLFLLLSVAILGFACSGNEIDYSKIQSVEIDNESIVQGFLLSEFDVSQIKLNITYKPTLDENGKEVPGEVIQISVTENMIKAEDKAKLGMPGSNNISIIYGKFTIEFILKLFDDTTQRVKVIFLNEDGSMIGDVQYIALGGKPVVPNLETKSGFVFVGWKEGDSFSNLENITKDTTLMATYAPSYYEVTFYQEIGDTSTQIGEAVRVPRGKNAYDYAPQIPIVAGYSNGRWKDTAAMEGVDSVGLKFYAIYDRDQIKITYNYIQNTGAVTAHIENTFVNEEIKNPPVAEASGYKFVGWYANDKKITFPYLVTNEMTFTAKYIDINKGSGLSYTATEGGYEITGYDGKEEFVVIPINATVGGVTKSVVSIKDGVFKDYDIKEFVVSENNEYFKTVDSVLYNFAKTKIIAYPKTKVGTSYTLDAACETIGKYAFYNAQSLEVVTLSNKVVEIGEYAFAQCHNLSAFTIKKSVTQIGEGAFKISDGTSALSSITIESLSELTYIGDYAFYGLSSLTSISLPLSLNYLGDSVFYNCRSLATITVSNATERNFNVLGGALYSKNYKILYAYAALYDVALNSEFVIDSRCETIKSGAFTWAKISTVLIGSAAEPVAQIDIQDNAFECPNLTDIRIFAESINYTINSFNEYVPNIYVMSSYAEFANLSSAFSNKVKVYQSNAWVNAENYSDHFIYRKETVIKHVGGSTVTATEITILGSRKKIENLNIPNVIGTFSVTKIAPYAFSEDDVVQSVVLPADLTEIGYKAFANAKNLQKVTIGDLVTKIGDEAFSGCNSLEEFVFTDTLQISSFGVNVTQGTAWQNSSEKLLILGNVLVKYNGLDVSVTIPERVSYIATDCFEYKSNLTSVIFEKNNISIIDSRAFQFCSGLASITFPMSITHIKSEAFFGCSYLYVVTYNDIFTANNVLIVEDNAYDTHNPVYQIYSDTTLYDLTYYIDSTDSDTHKGIAFVTPLRVQNTGSSRFAGWYEDNEYLVNAKFPLSITANTTLYAKWIPIASSTTGLNFDLNESGQYTVTGYVGSDSYVIVPELYKGKKVTEIGAGAFKNKSFITKIELPNTLETSTGAYKSEIQIIGEEAFDGTFWFDNYQGDFVIIDDILIKYKGRAKEVSLPTNISKIAKGAFKGNEIIEKVILSYIINSLSDSVFENCSNLHTVMLPGALLQIGNKAFSNCEKLINLDFSLCVSLSNIGHDALDNTLWLNSYVDDCVLINKIFYKYRGSSNNLHIINMVESVSERAFYDNKTIKTVYIPESVMYIGESAFEGCIALTDVRLFAGGNALESISDKSFYGCTNLRTLNLNLADNLRYIGAHAFENCTNYTNLIIPANLETLGDYAFYGAGLKTITISEGSRLTTINSHAFAQNGSLASIVFSGANNLKTIGEYAFEDDTSLRIFSNLYSKIEIISAGAFYNCEELASFDMDQSLLNEIGDDALKNVGVLSNDANMVLLGNILVSYNGKDKVVRISNQITAIYNEAFYNNALITEIIFEEGSNLKSINTKAFFGCVNLEKINFPSSIVYVGDEVMTGTKWYNNRRNEEFIYIGSTLIKYNATTIKQVIIPDYITVINANTFKNTAVYDITIGESVIRIAEGAFDGIKTDIYANWTITMLGENPPKLLDMEEISAYRILLNSADTMESFRLDAGWAVQYAEGKLFAKPTYEVTFVIEEGTAEPIAPQQLYAIYSEIGVDVYDGEELGYIFTGWYYDKYYNTPLEYPLMLSGSITIYAKCVDKSVGSNPSEYRVENGDTISVYHYNKDKKIVVIAQLSGQFITTIGQTYLEDDDGKFVYQGKDSETGEEFYEEDPASTAQRYSLLGAFERHTELLEVYFASGTMLTTIGENAFADCTNLRKIVIPSTIKTIKSGAFKNCTSLQEIVFMEGATNIVIEEGAFENCTALTTFHLPDGISDLANNAFSGCTNLKDIYVTAATPITLGEGVLPFELLEGLVIHIPHSRYNFYATAWAAYADYLEEND